MLSAAPANFVMNAGLQLLGYSCSSWVIFACTYTSFRSS